MLSIGASGIDCCGTRLTAYPSPLYAIFSNTRCSCARRQSNVRRFFFLPLEGASGMLPVEVSSAAPRPVLTAPTLELPMIEKCLLLVVLMLAWAQHSFPAVRQGYLPLSVLVSVIIRYPAVLQHSRVLPRVPATVCPTKKDLTTPQATHYIVPSTCFAVPLLRNCPL